MRVLVTGSSGRLGGEIVRQLREAGHDPVGLDAAAGPETERVGSVTDAPAVRAATAGADAIVHVAALHAPHVPSHSRARFVDVNVSGTLTVLEAAAAAGVPRVVYTSTTSVYGDALVPTDRAVWVTEALEPRPRDIYDITKLAAEALCRDFARREGLAVTCLRVARCFPEPAAVLAAYRLHRGLDVRDAAGAHVLALARAGDPFEVLNVAARTPFHPEDAAELLRDAPAVVRRRAPCTAELFAARGWPLPPRIDRVYAIDRAAATIGYAPRHGVDAVA